MVGLISFQNHIFGFTAEEQRVFSLWSSSLFICFGATELDPFLFLGLGGLLGVVGFVQANLLSGVDLRVVDLGPQVVALDGEGVFPGSNLPGEGLLGQLLGRRADDVQTTQHVVLDDVAVVVLQLALLADAVHLVDLARDPAELPLHGPEGLLADRKQVL